MALAAAAAAATTVIIMSRCSSNHWGGGAVGGGGLMIEDEHDGSEVQRLREELADVNARASIFLRLTSGGAAR